MLVMEFSLAGFRLGRKTYLIEGAPADQRPTYVALGNTIIGVLTILGGGLGWFGEAFSLQVLVGVLTGFALLGALLAFRLPPAVEMRT
jgi:hypothetical protein